LSHFAEVDENNVVTNVIVVHDWDAPSEAGGIEFLTQLTGHANWKQTSYNGNIRKNYAGIGYSYDQQRDAFIAPQPYPSWTLNEIRCQWEAPTTYPIDGKTYVWDEPTLSWKEIV
jgi:hypothetical protein